LFQLEGINRNLKSRVNELESSVESLSSENEKLSKRGRSLDRNISVLYATALADLEAKNRMIEDLKRE
jgi:tetrahydromethanopterin S-methyltransferase subunit G